MNLNSNTHSQAKIGKQGRSPVGCSPRLHRFNLSPFGFDGVVRDYTLRNLFKNPKHDNLTSFSLKLFFNVKILKKLQGF